MISLLQDGCGNLITREGLIVLEEHILMTLEFELQWAGPIPFIERFSKLFDLQRTSQIQTLCNFFSQVAALSSDLCLGTKLSSLAAAIFFLSLNVVSNNELCAQFELKYVKIAVEKGDGPLGWAKNSQFMAATGINAVDVVPVYT